MCPMVLDSRSTQLRGAFGGHQGRALRQGDTLRAGTPGRGRASDRLRPRARGLVDAPGSGRRACRARAARRPSTSCFTQAAQATFWQEAWKITAQSDRYGYRLAGTPLETARPLEMRSHGIVPGVIQVPAGGQPIVQMRDAQPSGGYPKIGTVIEADLWRLGQAPIGSHIRFIETTWEEAVGAIDETQAWLDESRRLLELHWLGQGGN